MSELKKIQYNTNLGDIKSSYIIEELFSFLGKKQKLNLVKYNLKLQKTLLFDIWDYRKITRKYKLGERNGKGKEYLNNKLIFEGDI